MISARTKAALAASKARGTKLGGFRGRAGTAEDTARARAARTLKATEQARSIAPIIDRVDPDGTASLRGIARALNDEGVPTPSGEGTWTAATVARLRKRLEQAQAAIASSPCKLLLHGQLWTARRRTVLFRSSWRATKRKRQVTSYSKCSLDPDWPIESDGGDQSA
jgi:hypothetical protein